MTGNRTMEEMFQAPTEGYGDAIVVQDILANFFEIKTGLLSLIQANQFHGFESNNPHDHIRSFIGITSTLKFRNVPNDAINLMLFPVSTKFEIVSVSLSILASVLYELPLEVVLTLEATGLIHALLHMPKFALMFKSLLNNKEKLFDLATTPVNENCSAVILKKLPEKLGDPGKFLIPSLADLGASINLMPLSIWKRLSLPELTFTQMILELADRSMTRPAGIAKDVFVKVGKFHFSSDFIVVDYVVDPRVLLILGRPFLRTERALIDFYGKELTLHVDDEAITFKVGQTSKYSYNDVELISRIDIIDVAYEEYVQEEKCHFMVKEGIILGHKISKSEIEVDRAKVDVIAKLPHPTSIKGAKNLAADHLSRLENPHQDELEKKEITEIFPLKTLGMIAFRGDSSTLWFVDFANYHAGNFIVKGMSSQQKKKFFKDVKHYF
nr:reverse transcriptase domain-containing protein [Tanacetum cinerariifolium]